MTGTNKYSGKVGRSVRVRGGGRSANTFRLMLRRNSMTRDGADVTEGEDSVVFRDGCKLFCMICSSKQVERERTQGHKAGSEQGCLCRRYQSNGDQTRPTFINFMMATKATFIMPLLFPLILFHSLIKSSDRTIKSRE